MDVRYHEVPVPYVYQLSLPQALRLHNLLVVLIRGFELKDYEEVALSSLLESIDHFVGAARVQNSQVRTGYQPRSQEARLGGYYARGHCVCCADQPDDEPA